MTSAGFGAPGIPGKVDQPWGHALKNGSLQPSQIDNAPVMGPADETAGTIRRGSPELAEERLRWRSETSIEDGLRRVWTWLEGQS